MKQQDFLRDVVDYVELTDGLIHELKDRPVFSPSALKKAAAVLADARLIKAEEQEELIGLFKEQPDRALESLAKVAAAHRRPADYTLGGPGGRAEAKLGQRESDRVLLERLGLA